MTDYVDAWHIGGSRLGYGDDRYVRKGVKLTVKGEPVPCQHGLHASERLIDALQYASHPIIRRVRLSGQIVIDDDKMVATERTVLWSLTKRQSERLLRSFARRCALDVAHLWDAPSVVMEYLRTGRKRSAASDAAKSGAGPAAWSAGESAAGFAAESEAWSAAWLAAWAEIESASWFEAGSAAESEAWSAAWSAQNQILTDMVMRYAPAAK